MTAYYPYIEWTGWYFGHHVVDQDGKLVNGTGCLVTHKSEAAAKKCADRDVRRLENVPADNPSRVEGSD